MEEFNHFGQIAENVPKVLGQIVRKTAFDIEAGAKQRAAVDTGFLKNSIYSVTSTKSTYGRAVQKAKLGKNKAGVSTKAHLKKYVKHLERQRKQESMLLAEVGGADEQTAYVAVGAEYGIYVELGTTRMPAQPYFYPAVEAARPGFEAALSAVESKLDGVSGDIEADE